MNGAQHVRRLQYLVHSLWSQRALHEIADGDSAHKRGQPRILALLFRHILGEDLGGVLIRLQQRQRRGVQAYFSTNFQAYHYEAETSIGKEKGGGIGRMRGWW